MKKSHQGRVSAKVIAGWDPLEQIEVQPPDHPDHIDYYNEPDHVKAWATNHKTGHRRKRRRKLRGILGNCGDSARHETLRKAAGHVGDRDLAYPPAKHETKCMYAIRGYKDNYFVRRHLRREERALRAVRFLKYGQNSTA